MNKHIYTLSLMILLWAFSSCKQATTIIGTKVSNEQELIKTIEDATPGDVITMTDGVWNDIQIKFYGEGTEDRPITLRAETPGQVKIHGTSNLRLGGKHLVVDGLHFTNGASPSRSVIQYFINKDTLANHSRVTNCVIDDFNKSQKNKQDLWVLFKGRHNQLDHSYLAGKSNRGPTIRVDLAGNESIKNYHKIQHNHFGRRPPKGGPSAETIQIGDSYTSMSPSHTLVSDNLFEQCDGEVEVISSKTNFNEFRNNVFYKSEGSLVTRHGNYFIGDDQSRNPGGIRLIGTGHWITNNYFYKIKGEIFRAPLAVMNGIKKSPLNRYIQVTDVVVAHNTWVDCTSPWQFGVGSNIDQKDVLPASEIRSEVPIRTLVANNVIYHSKGDPMPLYRHDSIDQITFKSNVINNQGVEFPGTEGLQEINFDMTETGENIWTPTTDLSDITPHKGFEFEQITHDLFGNKRSENSSVGATISSKAVNVDILNYNKYGPSWFNPSPSKDAPNTVSASTTQELISALEKANNGDIINLSAQQYTITSPLKINKNITIQSSDANNKSTLSFTGAAQQPLFEMQPKGELNLKGLKLIGTSNNYAFAPLNKNMSSLYNLNVENSEISNFDFALKAYKHSFSEYIKFTGCTITNCKNGLELSSEDDDKGEYNAENLFVTNCTFQGIPKNVIDYYRGGYDESTVGGNLIVQNCTFSNSGQAEKNGVLINTYGIINVDISDNNFSNNRVQLIARLWGAKNNKAYNNTIKSSGKIITEQNLPLKLMY